MKDDLFIIFSSIDPLFYVTLFGGRFCHYSFFKYAGDELGNSSVRQLNEISIIVVVIKYKLFSFRQNNNVVLYYSLIGFSFRVVLQMHN